MKKLLSLVLIAVSVLTSSCFRKKYDCDCTYADAFSGAVVKTETEEIRAKTKAGALIECDDIEMSKEGIAGLNNNVSCVLERN
ncbi:MAG: hypothetical protein J0M08_00525 [Bacteroidetes bacterium]|nr:hypothetical protein [Bacteroidota bacterium]